MDAASNTAKGERLDVLVVLVEAYERKHYPLDLPDPATGGFQSRLTRRPRRSPPLWDNFCPDPFPDYGPQ
jgi:hypothetical protein